MITELDKGLFALETAHTGYYISLRGTLAETLHYGAKIHPSIAALHEKLDVSYGTDVTYRADTAPLSLQHLCLELSPAQKGDFRFAPLSVSSEQGASADFAFSCARIQTGSMPPADMPGAHDGDETLLLEFVSPGGLCATLVYTVYAACDVITRRTILRNNGGTPLTLRRACSYQLDLPNCDYTLSTFTGAWARERHETCRPLCVGAQTFGSTTGVSSHFCNPFFMLAQTEATEHAGDVYGFNLIYSGSHAACVEVDPYGKTRIAAGVQWDNFAWTLATDDVFETPEAVLTFSSAGKNGMSQNMHAFVNAHIVRGEWAKKERPILANNWEATYFDFTESKLLKIAKAAAKVGVELFVLDDGWFGKRDTDTAGLGDYTINRKKLPDGLDGLARKINAMGMQFGLWFEPEMVNADSDLYRAHPDWIVQTPHTEPCTCRNQYVLDLCRPEVREYIIAQVNATLQSAPIRYVKWDMNRPLTDAYSAALDEQGRFFHAYTLGLYAVLEAVTIANPHVLFEGCASGGNRFDLGILSYMPQIWTSDDTDAYERQKIQAGTSYGYPQSTMGCHVSAVPNHQTARTSPIETRFDAAAFGVLGYELDFTHLTPAETKAVAAQIAYYKQHRRLLQFGTFYRIASPFTDGRCEWQVVSADGTEAMFGEFLHLLRPNTAKPPLRMCALRSDALYEVTVRPQCVNIKTFGGLLNHVLPVKLNTDGLLVHKASELYMMPCETEYYAVYGDLLMHAGLRQKQSFTGTGYTENVRLMPDFSARMYYLQAQPEANKEVTP